MWEPMACGHPQECLCQEFSFSVATASADELDSRCPLPALRPERRYCLVCFEKAKARREALELACEAIEKARRVYLNEGGTSAVPQALLDTAKESIRAAFEEKWPEMKEANDAEPTQDKG